MSKRKQPVQHSTEQKLNPTKNVGIVALIGLVTAGVVSFGVANAQLPPRQIRVPAPGDSYFDPTRDGHGRRRPPRATGEFGIDESKYDKEHYIIGKKQVSVDDIVVEMTEVRPKDAFFDEKGSTGEGWLLVRQATNDSAGKKHGQIRMHFGDLNNSPEFSGMAVPIPQPFNDRVLVVRGGGSMPQLMIIHRAVRLQGVNGGSFFTTPDKRYLVVLNPDDVAPSVTVYDATQDKTVDSKPADTKDGIKQIHVLEQNGRYFIVGTGYHEDWLVGWQFDPMTGTLESFSGNKQNLQTATAVPWLFDMKSVPDECRVLVPDKEPPKTI